LKLTSRTIPRPGPRGRSVQHPAGFERDDVGRNTGNHVPGAPQNSKAPGGGEREFLRRSAAYVVVVKGRVRHSSSGHRTGPDDLVGGSVRGSHGWFLSVVMQLSACLGVSDGAFFEHLLIIIREGAPQGKGHISRWIMPVFSDHCPACAKQKHQNHPRYPPPPPRKRVRQKAFLFLFLSFSFLCPYGPPHCPPGR